jgi:hypothetical protein
VPLRLLAERIERRAEYDLADFRCTGQLFLPQIGFYAGRFGVGAKVESGRPFAHPGLDTLFPMQRES